MALRRLSDKLTYTEETLLSRTNDLAQANNDLLQAQSDATTARTQAEEARTREEEGKASEGLAAVERASANPATVRGNIVASKRN